VKPPGPNDDDRNLDVTACKILAVDTVKDRMVAETAIGGRYRDRQGYNLHSGYGYLIIRPTSSFVDATLFVPAIATN
jgi:hypothetical protein